MGVEGGSWSLASDEDPTSAQLPVIRNPLGKRGQVKYCQLSLEHFSSFHHEIVTIEGVGGRGGKPTNGAAKEPTEGQEE